MLMLAPEVSWRKAGFPVVEPGAFVHKTAVVIGEVIVKSGTIIYPLAVIRADEGCPIIIGESANVQDGVIIHCLKGGQVVVGPRCSLAHGAVIHGPCEIGEGTFVGFRAVVAKSRLGRGCFVGHGALVEGVEVPDNRFIPPGAVITRPEEVAALGEVSAAQREFAREVLSVNQELCSAYRQNMRGDE